jgi:hypothetical protein
MAGKYFTTKYYDKRPDKSPTYYESKERLYKVWDEKDVIESCKNPNNETYSFIVAGHTYGSPGAKYNGLYEPLIKKIDLINQCKSMTFGFILGDTVVNASNKEFKMLKRDLQLLSSDMNNYIVPGNHDVGMGHDNAKRDIFIQNFGKTYQHFEYNDDLFILLDTNFDKWNILGDQLELLKSLSKSKKKYNNVFVFTHQVVWYDKNKDRGSFVTIKTNSLEGYPKDSGPNFWGEIFPILSNIGENTYLFAGDVGAWPNNSEFFYDRYSNTDFFATGMGGGERDNFLMISVINGVVKVALVPLNDKKI